MNAPQEIVTLVKKFSEHYESYKSPTYNEAQLRKEFLDVFFKALGWDVENNQGLPEAYKEVIHEDSIKIGILTKAPDYCFRTGGIRKFFVEAKKTSENLQDNPRHAFQLRRYAWSAKLPIGILTDFEEFVVYDTRHRPFEKDPATKYRIFYAKYTELVERWDEIYNLFSKKAVEEGSLDAYADLVASKKGTTEVDDEFLKEIEKWREILAKDIAKNNPTLTTRELNYSVQKTIDRIIFLRICEDRGIENEARLLALARRSRIYPILTEIFEEADNKYNSGLFHFSEEKNQSESTDTLTLKLNISDSALKEIISNLYLPNSPYEFSVMPADVLGQVYEQFLGKVIRLTEGHEAVVEDKPEVKKAGGVFYTPTFIVDYIVKNTVGKLLVKKTPKQVEKLKILDPACGSGSFLLGAYEYLLKWHLDYYIEHLVDKYYKGKNPIIYQIRTGEWRLTTSEKRRILLNNIYGVDIDTQAVEVTKLSLLLKVLEGESQETLQKQLKLFHERALPDLGSNIKCGNSLIGPDIYSQQTLDFVNNEEKYRINAFDWNQEFNETMSSGGFDAVIGNPPYVRQEILGNYKDYFEKRYSTYHGMADLYVYFIERSLEILNKKGAYGVIVANKWLRANYGESLRAFLRLRNILEIVDFQDQQVFENATTYTCLLFVQKDTPDKYLQIVKVNSKEFTDLAKFIDVHKFTINQQTLSNESWSLANESTQKLLEKLKKENISLRKYTKKGIYYGVKTGLNDAFVISQETTDKLLAADSKNKEVIKPFLIGKQVKRYIKPEKNLYIIFLRRGSNIDHYPRIKEFLHKFKERLLPKPINWIGNWNGRKSGNYEWYEIQDPVEYYKEFEKSKIIVPCISKRPSATFDTELFLSNDKTAIIPTDDLYLLGIINSYITNFVINNIASSKQNGYFEYKPMYLAKIPIHTINPTNQIEKDTHGKIVHLVKFLMELNSNFTKAGTSHEKELIKRQISSSESQINQMVYDLYGLTKEEINIVEESSSKS